MNHMTDNLALTPNQTLGLILFLGLIVYNFNRKRRLLIKAQVPTMTFVLVGIGLGLLIIHYLRNHNPLASLIGLMAIGLLYILMSSNGIVKEGIQNFRNPHIALITEKWDKIRLVELDTDIKTDTDRIRLKFEGYRFSNTIFFDMDHYDRILEILGKNLEAKKIKIEKNPHL